MRVERRDVFAVMLALACHLALFALPGINMQTVPRLIPPRRVSIRLIEPLLPAITKTVQPVLKKEVHEVRSEPVVVQKETPVVHKKIVPVPIEKPVPVRHEEKPPVITPEEEPKLPVVATTPSELVQDSPAPVSQPRPVSVIEAPPMVETVGEEVMAPPIAVTAPERVEQTVVSRPSEPAAPIVIEARPLYRRNPPPRYPKAARRRNQQGIVILEVLVNKSGTVDELRVHSSSGHTVLDRAAVKAVESWLFLPAGRGREQISAWVRVPVRFNLRGKK